MTFMISSELGMDSFLLCRQGKRVWKMQGCNFTQVQKREEMQMDDTFAVWNYSRALHTFNKNGDGKKARKLLKPSY